MKAMQPSLAAQARASRGTSRRPSRLDVNRVGPVELSWKPKDFVAMDAVCRVASNGASRLLENAEPRSVSIDLKRLFRSCSGHAEAIPC
jgi:hypothetical protein